MKIRTSQQCDGVLFIFSPTVDVHFAGRKNTVGSAARESLLLVTRDIYVVYIRESWHNL